MPDAGRVAPISGSVFYQIYRLESKSEAMYIVPGHCALMGATRLASGHFSAASGRVAPISACVSSCANFCSVEYIFIKVIIIAMYL